MIISAFMVGEGCAVGFFVCAKLFEYGEIKRNTRKVLTGQKRSESRDDMSPGLWFLPRWHQALPQGFAVGLLELGGSSFKVLKKSTS